MNATISLIRHEKVAEGTLACWFSKPAGFGFRAGQAIDLTLIDPPETDGEGNIRTFTIASAPYEAHLMIATRARNTAFKRVLGAAAGGTSLKLEGPSGSFGLHKNVEKPAVLLAGGIGITPFLSIVRQTAREGVRRTIYLFYSNRRPEDAAFLGALRESSQEGRVYRFIPTMTDMTNAKEPWTGETGHIDEAMLRRHMPSLQGPIYYVAGPEAMVAGMRDMLTSAKVDEDDIRFEEFPGY